MHLKLLGNYDYSLSFGLPQRREILERLIVLSGEEGLTMTKHIIVVGSGPAGIEAAKAAAKAGSQVSLISEGPVGGRAGWHSLLPSKVWLTAADTAGLLAESPM